MLDPSCVMPYMDKEEPRRAYDRVERVLPSTKKSSTDTLDPNRDIPQMFGIATFFNSCPIFCASFGQLTCCYASVTHLVNIFSLCGTILYGKNASKIRTEMCFVLMKKMREDVSDRMTLMKMNTRTVDRHV